MPLLALLKTKTIFPKMLHFSSRGSQYAAWNKVREETGFRSGYEAEVQKRLPEGVLYESIKIPYHIEMNANYTPDWIMPSQCILIEAKGEFRMEDRNKMLILKRQYPDLDIRLLFQNVGGQVRLGVDGVHRDAAEGELLGAVLHLALLTGNEQGIAVYAEIILSHGILYEGGLTGLKEAVDYKYGYLVVVNIIDHIFCDVLRRQFYQIFISFYLCKQF